MQKLRNAGKTNLLMTVFTSMLTSTLCGQMHVCVVGITMHTKTQSCYWERMKNWKYAGKTICEWNFHPLKKHWQHKSSLTYECKAAGLAQDSAVCAKQNCPQIMIYRQGMALKHWAKLPCVHRVVSLQETHFFFTKLQIFVLSYNSH